MIAEREGCPPELQRLLPSWRTGCSVSARAPNRAKASDPGKRDVLHDALTVAEIPQLKEWWGPGRRSLQGL